jgi:CrcB protein
VTPLVFVAVALVGGVGAVARLVLDAAVSGAAGRAFPFGTLAVNVIGALTLGVLAGAELSKGAYEISGIGLVGAFTTFSTWALESHRLGEDGRLRLGLLNFLLSLIVGLAAVWAGRHLGAAL